METTSWFLTGDLIVITSTDRDSRITSLDGGATASGNMAETRLGVSLVTVLRYEHWFGAAWWPCLAWIHRLIVPKLLTKAEAIIRRRE
jgi:hypothetical protein